MTDGKTTTLTITTSEDYFRVLFSCIALALGLLIGMHIVQARSPGIFPPWFSVIAGVTPLIFYHLGYLAPRAKRGISQTAIDSVYYFGFLITVAALGISAVAIAQSAGAIDIKPIVYQFGVGLFATGYAVVARMHVSSISKMLDEVSPEAIIDKYIQRSRALVENVEMAVVSFAQITEKSVVVVNQLDTLSVSILKKIEDTAQRAQILATKSVMASAKVFEDEMRSTMASSKQALLDIRALMTETSFIDERKQLVESLKATVETTAKVNQSLIDFNAATIESSRASSTTAHSQMVLGEALGALGNSVDVLVGPDGGLQRAARDIADVGVQVSLGTGQLTDSVAKLNSVTQQLSEGASSQLKLNKLLKKAEEQLSNLSGVTERFGSVLEQTQAATESSSRTVGELNKVAAALPLLFVRVGELSESLGSASTSSNGLFSTASRLPDELNQVRGQLESVVAQVKQLAQVSSETAAAGLAIQSDLRNSVAAGDAAKRLLETSERMATTLQSIETSVSRLPASVQGLEMSLIESAKFVKNSVESSARILETDVQRSASAASLLTISLADVAKNIVNSTRAHQGLPQ